MATVNIRRGNIMGELRIELSVPGGPIHRDLIRRGKKVESRAKQIASSRVRTGAMRSSIHSRPAPSAASPLTVIIECTVPYAIFQHDGTGLYGPRGDYIRPRRSKLLRWQSRTGQVIYAKRVRGVKPLPFLVAALPAMRD